MKTTMPDGTMNNRHCPQKQLRRKPKRDTANYKLTSNHAVQAAGCVPAIQPQGKLGRMPDPP
jgi:hypothetical protein